MSAESARRAAETAARASYGRLLALLVAHTKDIAAAEDALAEAFVAALRTWPERGVPDNPQAWLLTAARHRWINALRHHGVADAAAADLALLADEHAPEAHAVPDARLKLLFVCAHPAIAAAHRTPLMLQTVLGLSAEQIAQAFLVAPATMGQRMVRAKAKIRDAGLRFELPAAEDMPERLADVLEAIYAAFGTSWDSVAGAAEGPQDLAAEALFLGRLLVALLPAEPEAQGLLALMLYCESRRAARRDGQGRFVPLAQQERKHWQRNLIIEAEGLLTQASRAARFGRFQCEAAIQSVHAQAAVTGNKQHAALETLYGLLAQRCPSVGASVGWAAAQFDAGRLPAAMATLEGLAAGGDIARYQPYWVTRSRVLAAAGQVDEARHALRRAVELTTDPAVRAFLLQG